jgi:uncharacterized membrane protein
MNDNGRPPQARTPDLRPATREEIQAHWPALLPPPATLAEYAESVPDAAERILSMAEQSVTRKLEFGHKLAEAEIKAAKTALSVAFSLALMALVSSVVFFVLGNQVAGIAFASVLMAVFARLLLARPARAEPSIERHHPNQ